MYFISFLLFSIFITQSKSFRTIQSVVRKNNRFESNNADSFGGDSKPIVNTVAPQVEKYKDEAAKLRLILLSLLLS